jgi:peptidoglycan-associated lipoprotein
MKKYAMIVLLVGTMLVGCRTKPTGEMVGSENPYGGSFIEGSAAVDDNANFPQDGDRSVFEPVYFDFDSSQVKPSESGKVEVVAMALKKGEYGGVIVEGHADERGSREYNLALSETRSLAVRDYLINLGVDKASIQTRSYGEEQPDNAGHDETAWNKNRRVVFAVY